ncbi:MAG: DUF5724 domain-containing protein [Eubacteriales bacterium]
MDKKEFLESKEIKEKIKKQLLEIKKCRYMSDDEKGCATLLLEKEVHSARYFSLNEGSLTYARTAKILKGNKYKKNKSIYKFLFGEGNEDIIIECLGNIGKLAFQLYYDRRSYRVPNNKSIITSGRTKFLVILNHCMRYDMPLVEYFRYNLDNNQYFWMYAAEHAKRDENLLNELIDGVYGRHEFITISRDLIGTLLFTNDKRAYKAIEDLLLSAQRQEGLRQSILECLDETTVEAQKYFMRVILDNNLIRFSSVKRALFTWCGLVYEAQRENTVKRLIELGHKYLENPAEIPNGINSQDSSECYMALWAKACTDVEKTFTDLHKIFDKGNTQKKLLALDFAYSTKLIKIYKELGKKAMLSDNIYIFMRGLDLLDPLMYKQSGGLYSNRKPTLHNYIKVPDILKIYDNALVQYRKAKDKKLDEADEYFDFINYKIDSSRISKFMYNVSSYAAEKEKDMVKMFAYLDANTRSIMMNRTANKLEKTKKCSNNDLELIFLGVQDKGSSIRQAAFEAIKYVKIDSDNQRMLEDLLRTKNSAYRKAIINVLMSLDTKDIKRSIERLMDKDATEYQLGALDMLNQMKSKGIEKAWVKQKAKYYRANLAANSQAEILLKNILDEKESVLEYSKENGFGLYDVENIREYTKPKKPDETTMKLMHLSDTELELVNDQLIKLKEIIEDNKDYEYTSGEFGLRQTLLIGNRITSKSSKYRSLSGEELLDTYPLADIWKKWYKDSGLTPRQLFLARVYMAQCRYMSIFEETANKNKGVYKYFLYGFKEIKIVSKTNWRNSGGASSIIDVLTKAYPFDDSERMGFYINQLEYFVASVKESDYISDNHGYRGGLYNILNSNICSNFNREIQSQIDCMNKELLERYINLVGYVNITVYKIKIKESESNSFLARLGYGLTFDTVCKGFQMGILSEDDFIDNLTTPSLIGMERGYYSKSQNRFFKKYPFLEGYMKKISQRLLEIETARGDASTKASYLACSLQYVRGMESYMKILNALGKSGLHSGHMWDGVYEQSSKKEMLSFLLRQSMPDEGEDYAKFKELADKYKISRTKLIESAVYSPAWVKYVKEYLRIEYFESAVWWIYAHTNGANNVENLSEISKYSNIELADFRNGAVDVDWFNNVYSKIDCWDEIYKCGKYVTDGNGHTRAQLFADAILKKVSIEDAIAKVEKTRNKDYLRIVGLIPLGESKKKDMLERYNFIQKFAKESRQFGAQRQASEKIAVQIAIDNLARTSGYMDSMRFIWNMETENTIDILSKSQGIKVGEITVSIVIDENGKSGLQIQKGDKTQKTIPEKHKKSETILQMKSFIKELNTQGKRVVKSMEDAMINMDYFEADEIEKLMKNPIIKPVLKKLVIKAGDDLGFYEDGNIVGTKRRKIEQDEKVYIAHCYDLYKSGDWGYFQEKCFAERITQPFKQIFRELYVPTEEELFEKSISRRYAGYQVAAKKTAALLKSRGWQINYEEGLKKYYKKQNILVNMYAYADWFTPADVEAPSLELIHFLDANKGDALDIKDIEPTIFSETMRDMDLVVSVAYVGGVDPEASHSTIEMRRALITETAKLFKLDNYQLKDNHAIINGHYGDYSVHLGSGVVHKILGAHLSILPVHSAQRGRLFLPFMDNDPKSAEILSKVLLLCQDNKIKDPTILRQVE